MNILIRLFYEFFKTGLFAAGGGLATIPFLYDIADKTGWFTNGDLADMIAISESTPGAIGVNMASYVGFTVYGIIGCIIATLGLILPSVVIILIISKVLDKFKDNEKVKAVFYGLRPASVALVSAAGIEVVKITLIRLDIIAKSNNILLWFNWKSVLFTFLLYYLVKKFNWHPVFYILLSGIVGILFAF